MFQKLKKIELHLHLDGSIRKETMEKILKRKIDEKEITVEKDNKDLTQYLEKFQLPISIMQSKENLKIISQDLIEQLREDNVIYAEVRFAPIFHTQKGLTLKEVVDSVLEGLKDKEIKTNLILCMMRGQKEEENRKIITLAKAYLNKGVCAIDLAGDEKKYPTNLYRELLKEAKQENIPFTIHAGEAGTTKDIEEAIALGATRIGHGIKTIEKKSLLEQIKEKNICLEICPTSNLQTNVVKNIENHPIKSLQQQGITISINTDNRTVSNTTLTKEYELLEQTFHYTKRDFIDFNKNSLIHSFLPEKEKENLLKIIINQ